MVEEIKNIFGTRKFKIIIYIIIGLLVLLFVFQAGMSVGFEKASFYNKVGENYFHEINGGPNSKIMGIQKGDFESAHGAVGQIVELKLPLITIEDRSGIEKTIEISSSTQIKDANGDEKTDDLKTDDFVVAFGSPSSSTDPVLLARLIRVLPPPPPANQN